MDDGRVAEIGAALGRLRRAQAEALAPMPQAEVVAALAALAARWRDPCYPPRRTAERLDHPFPFAMTRVSLDALLDSLTPAALWALIDSEGVRDAVGLPVVGHVIAGNTPLLSWVSVVRALLMRSASFVKLPSGPVAAWGRAFAQSLADVSPTLAACVHWAQWPGGTAACEAALCRGADLVMAYGGDETLRSLRALCPAATPLIGYGHRVSFGLVLRGAVHDEAARGLATDVLLYDQGGCLSPQTIFVEGGRAETVALAARLARALPEAAARYPLPARTLHAAQRVREARDLARMGAGNALWEDESLRWTVIARPDRTFVPSPTHGVLSVQPLESVRCLAQTLAPVASSLQGCAVASPPGEKIAPALIGRLAALDVSRVCPPGQLQAPPLAWRQDGRDVLRPLLGLDPSV